MKRVLFTIVLILAAQFADAGETKKNNVSSLQAKRVARGEYLVTIAACHDCHSPKARLGSVLPDPSRPLSGRPATTAAPAQPQPGQVSASPDLTAWYGPWGVSYAANLTPDPETGIGRRYTEAAFIKTLRTGRKPEGEPLLPPMPWENFGKMTDEDLKSVYAYLQTLKPVKNFVRSAAPMASSAPQQKASSK